MKKWFKVIDQEDIVYIDKEKVAVVKISVFYGGARQERKECALEFIALAGEKPLARIIYNNLEEANEILRMFLADDELCS